MVKSSQRVLALCLALTMVFACMTFTASATVDQYVKSDSKTYVQNYASNIIVTVSMNNVDYLKGLQASFTYDSNNLTCTNVTAVSPGGFGSSVFTANYATPGVVNVLAANKFEYDPADQSTWWIYDAETEEYSMPSTFVFCKLIFKTKAGAAAGVYPITATDVKASKDGGVIEVLGNAQMGSITLTQGAKIDPIITSWPTGASITYGQTFAAAVPGNAVAVTPGVFSIQDATLVPNAGDYTKTVTFIPTDTNTYNTKTQDISVTVNKATPTVSAWPTANAITFGQTFSSALIGGTASVPGAFAIADATSTPNAGGYTKDVTFTPTDTTNYNIVTGGSVNVTVNKADPSVTWPAPTVTYSPGLKLSDIDLGAGFTWSAPTTALSVPGGSYEAIYKPSDEDNYNTLTQNVTVTVNKATQIAPSISIASKNATSVTVTPVAGAEYGIKVKGSSDAVAYGSSNVLAGLASSTTYTVYVRMAATSNYEASSDATIDVTTDFQLNKITAVTLNTPANLVQTAGATSAVNFTATATPSASVDLNTIEWYVNDVKQATTGASFSYTPSAAGSYVVSVKVSDNASASVESKTITVAAAGSQFLLSNSKSGSVTDVTTPLTVTVTMSNVDYLKGIQATFNYDPTALMLSAVIRATDGFGNMVFTQNIQNSAGYATVLLSNNFEYDPANSTTWWIYDEETGEYSMPTTYTVVKLIFKAKAGAAAGTYPITVTDVKASKDGGVLTPLDAPQLGSVTLVDTRIDPVITSWPTVSAITYGQNFADAMTGGVSVTQGTFSIQDATVVPDVNTYTKIITFTPTDTTTYKTATQSVSVTVNKANQAAPAIAVAKTTNAVTITPVTGAEYGLKLKSSSDAVVYGSSNVFNDLTPNTAYTAYIRLAATNNYNASPETSADVTTDAFVPSLITSVALNTPANLSQTYGTTQAVNFTATSLPATDTDLNTIEWYVNTVKQATTGLSFSYTPVNAGSYVVAVKVSNNASATVDSKTITVAKVDPSVTWPAPAVTYSPSLKLSDIDLGAGFTWSAPTTALSVPGGSYEATYKPSDEDNYNTLTQNVTVTVNKATQIAPSISIASKNATSVTVTPVAGAEYGIKVKGSSDAVAYGSSNVLAGLASSTTYTVYVRMAATSNYEASPDATIDVTTDFQLNKITAVTLNTPANLVQTAGATSAVNFTATATPSASVDLNTIEWYVNDVKQATAGASFSYTPSAAGSYVVSVKVSDNASASVESKTITVAAAGSQFLLSNSKSGSVTDVTTPLTVTVTMSNVDYLKGIQATFNYDPTALMLSAVTRATDGFGNMVFTQNIQNSAGYATVLLSNKFEYDPANSTTWWIYDEETGEYSMPTTYTVVKLIFKAKAGAAAGTYPITVTDVKASKDGGILTPLDAPQLGSVTLVDTRIDPVITSWPTVSAITYGQTFADAMTGGVSVTQGTFSIQDATVVPDANTYTKIITFTPTDTATYKTATQSVSVTVNKANQAAPAIAVAKTANSVTITSVAGAEYGLKLANDPNAVVYGNSNVFNDLTPNTAYTAYIRMAASQNYNASTAATTSITTDIHLDKITALALNTPANLNQTYGAISAVSFTATTTPLTNVDVSTIEWYVNNVKQATTGATFSYTPVNAGNYVVSVKVSDNAAATVDSKTIAVAQATPTYEIPTLSAVTYSSTAKLSDISLPTGWAWDAPTTVPTVDITAYSATYTPVVDTANYTTVTKAIPLTVNKATPTFEVPTLTAITYSATGKLSDVTLPTGWAWNAPNTVPTVNVSSYPATFTPTDTINYNTATASVSVTVNKATPAYTIPTIAAVTYSPTGKLADTLLPVGWAWVDGNTVPTVNVTEYAAIFTPEDVANYVTVNEDVPLTVNKAVPAYTVPTLEDRVYNKNTKLSDPDIEGELTEGWTWDEPNTVPTVDVESYPATFTPTDAVNYATVSVNVPQKTTKANPTVDFSTVYKRTYKSNLKLSSIILSDGYTWDAPDTVLSVSSESYPATFTPNDTVNYNVISGEFKVIVSKESTSSGGGSGSSGGGITVTSPSPTPVVTTPPTQKPAPKDIAQEPWAANYIQDVINRGIMSGYSEEDGSVSFKPAATATRAEFATALFNYLGFEKSGSSTFGDTKNHWSNSYVAKLVEEGIMTGYNASEFGPDDQITREQIATILGRAFKVKAATSSFKYTDDSSISSWAAESVYAVREAGFMTGDADGSFRASDTATRAEIATIFSRLAQANIK